MRPPGRRTLNRREPSPPTVSNNTHPTQERPRQKLRMEGRMMSLSPLTQKNFGMEYSSPFINQEDCLPEPPTGGSGFRDTGQPAASELHALSGLPKGGCMGVSIGLLGRPR